MTKEHIEHLVEKQRIFFRSNITLNVDNRICVLKKLRKTILEYENEIAEALYSDLGKSKTESYMCEVGLIINEIDYMLRHIRQFAKEKTVATPIGQFLSHSFKKPAPYGVTLIISPWNYPFLLTFEPLVDAIAAGNTVVIKPSSYSPASGLVIEKLIQEVFCEEYVATVSGGREENSFLLEQKFDYIFFTGSKNVGKIVLEKATQHTTPVTLELGGKSPCIIEKTANLNIAARRIIFGKLLNCGQTCVAPDYILCDETVKDIFISCLKNEIIKQFGKDCLNNPSYGKIINKKHFDRIINLIDNEKIVFGGNYDCDSLKIEPCIMDNVSWNDDVMKEEIFGPILPIISFSSVDEVIFVVNSKEKPLALYIFSEDKEIINKVCSDCCFGGGCINDVVIHIASNKLGFGGVGESGMGAYHGKEGFDTFSHYKSIVAKKTYIDMPMRYQPYKSVYEKIIRFFL